MAALNFLIILRACRYLLIINAVGSRTETEVSAVGLAAVAFFIVMPMMLVRRELPEPEGNIHVIFRLKRWIMLGLAFLLIFTPSICYLILLYRS